MSNSNDTLSDYIEYVKYWRGQIISLTVTLERFMDVYIASYFTQDDVKRDELIDLIVCTDRISFNNKLDIFKIIFERRDYDFYANNKSLGNQILKIIQKRNVFAHYHTYGNPEALELFKSDGTISFGKFKNDRSVVPIGRNELEQLSLLITECSNKVKELLRGHGFPV